MKLPTISVATIVKNESANISDFFRTINGVADELVLVDTGSSDETVALINQCAKSAPYSVRLFEKRFEPFHFGRAKNFAIDLCEKDYVQILDADQRMSEGYKKKVKNFLSTEPLVVETLQEDDVVPHFIDPQLRLFKNHIGIRYAEDEESRTDEVLIFSGSPNRFEEKLLHLQGGKYKPRRKNRWKEELQMDIQKTPREHGSLRELIRGMFAFYYIFKKIYINREAWKDGWEGLKYSFIRARYKLLIHFFVAFKPRRPDNA